MPLIVVISDGAAGQLRRLIRYRFWVGNGLDGLEAPFPGYPEERASPDRDVFGKRRVANPGGPYFSDVLIEVNLVLSFVPSPFTTAIMAREMPAAISPYSIAVAPDSSAKNLRRVFMPPILGPKR
jgi:hypothetical protein